MNFVSLAYTQAMQWSETLCLKHTSASCKTSLRNVANDSSSENQPRKLLSHWGVFIYKSVSDLNIIRLYSMYTNLISKWFLLG